MAKYQYTGIHRNYLHCPTIMEVLVATINDMIDRENQEVQTPAKHPDLKTEDFEHPAQNSHHIWNSKQGYMHGR